MAAADLPEQTTARTDIPRPAEVRRGSTDFSRRLVSLGTAHPSSPGYADARQAERTAEVIATLADAHKAGQATDVLHTTDGRRRIWSPARVAQQEKIVNALYAASADVPCEGKAILAGGLPGAGKTTVLTRQAGIDLSRYLTINPDEIKEEMARRGMVPEINGLTPMEATDLAHEESSLIAKRLALRAYAEGKNVIWDITMSSPDSTARRVTDLREAGYSSVEGIFVDISIEASVLRAGNRYREGHERYLAGDGLGGRHVAPEVIRAQADPDFGSANRRTFEQVKPGFDDWCRYDNSIDGRPAVLVDGSGAGHHEHGRQPDEQRGHGLDCGVAGRDAEPR